MSESSKEKEKSEEIFIEKKNIENKNEEEEINNFSIGGNIVFNDFKINLSSKYILNRDPETNLLNSSSILSFSHQLTPWMKYSLKEHKGALKFMTSMSPISNFLLTTKFELDNTEKTTSTPINVMAKYNFNNNLILQLGIIDYNLIKEKIPTNFCAGIYKPLNLWGNNKLGAGIFMNYSLNEKLFKKFNFAFDISNTYLKTIVNFSNIKKNKSSQAEKNLKINGEIKVSDKLTMGTEVNYNNTGSKGTKIQLFTKYAIDQFTDFFGKWDDKDKSIMFRMNHNFRGLLKLGITGKFTPVEGDKKEGRFFKIPPFKTKTGISIDISEPQI
jgi:hypothetical protein